MRSLFLLASLAFLAAACATKTENPSGARHMSGSRAKGLGDAAKFAR
jgi:hypothetical protein